MTAQATPAGNGPAARVIEGTKVYGEGDAEVRALDGVTMDFPAGQFTAIMGPSGSGKSTLMQCMAGLDHFTEGQAFLGGQDITMLKDRALTQLRRDKVGFIFQAYNLVPTLNVRENITLPMDIAGAKVDEEWLDTVVTAVGLGNRLTHRPSELSGGEQQRAAAARALASRPDIIFADEPTGALDTETGSTLLRFLQTATDEYGQTVVMVTHDPSAASHADRVIFLNDGRIVRELATPDAAAIFDTMKELGGA
jgi:putative ABC transport system ATP-binding protein